MGSVPNYTSIHDAVENNDMDAVKYFVETEIAVCKLTNKEEKTPAYIAAVNNNFPMLKYLLEEDNSRLYNGDMFGNNIMQRSIEHNAFDTVKYLVEHQNYDIHKRNNRYYGNTAIHHAAEEGKLEILKYFIEEKGGDVNVRNNVGETPLYNAAERPFMNVIKYLIEERNADAMALNDQHDNVLYTSAIAADMTVPKYLLDERKVPFDINWRNKNNYTIVYIATRWNRLDFVKYLVKEKHADVNIVDDQQRSPLHGAAFRNNLPICKVLVEDGGANLHAVDKFGNTPAEDAKEEDLVKYLQDMATKRSRRSVASLPFSHLVTAGEGSFWSNRLLRGNEQNCQKSLNSRGEFDGFLMLADTIIRHSKRSVHRRSERETLLSPREIIERKIDPLAVNAVNAFQNYS